MNHYFIHEDFKESQGWCKDFQQIIQQESKKFSLCINIYIQIIRYRLLFKKRFLIKIDKHEWNWTTFIQ